MQGYKNAVDVDALKKTNALDEDALYEVTGHTRKATIGIFGSYQYTLPFRNKDTFE